MFESLMHLLGACPDHHAHMDLKELVALLLGTVPMASYAFYRCRTCVRCAVTAALRRISLRCRARPKSVR